MTKLTIAPLSVPGSITTASQSAIEHAGRLFLQTADSPCARWITDAGLPYVSMDDLYDSSYDYDELNHYVDDSNADEEDYSAEDEDGDDTFDEDDSGFDEESGGMDFALDDNGMDEDF